MKQLAALLTVGLALGLLVAAAIDTLGSERPGAPAARAAPTAKPLATLTPYASTAAATATPTAAPERPDRRRRIAAALRRAVRDAEALNGRAEAVVLLEGSSRPLTAGTAGRRMRMWSMSKPVTAIAVLQALESTGARPSAAVRRAMTDAIVRSENCGQRRMVLELQQLAGGTAGAAQAFRTVLGAAGVTRPVIPPEPRPPDAICRDYLTRNAGGLPDPLGNALLLGTAEWTTVDAARFAAALGDERYGDAGETVFSLMRQRKLRSRENTSSDRLTGPLDWGAGKALAGRRPAYKAGWGGVNQRAFLAGQLVALRTPDGVVAIAAMFHPNQQPPLDDPGRTRAGAALEGIFRAVEREL